MNKTYPVVLYPQKILKFLVSNQSQTFNRSQSELTSGEKFPHPQLSVRFVTLQPLPSCLLFLMGILMVFSLAFLSPSWLVAAAWGAILLGLLGVGCNDKPTSKKQLHKPSNASTQVKTKTVFRSHQLRSILAGSVMMPQGTGSARVGVSEQAFGEVLRQIFPDVEQGLEFQNPQLSTPYSVDFALFHPSGLSMDIEVDEPYIGNTKQPHHCIDQGKDNIRNEFFTAGNWVVIRFSEKQVVVYPFSCCKVIASAIARVTGDYTYLTRLQNVADLPPDPMWTTRQAKKWAKENYRKTYL